MAEKTGHIEKMKFDFPTEAVLEVYKTSLGGWYRVTSQEFRSYDGPRRYTRPIKQPGHGDSFTNVPTETFEYNGPVYMSRTNREVYYEGSERVIDSTKSLDFKAVSDSRK